MALFRKAVGFEMLRRFVNNRRRTRRPVGRARYRRRRGFLRRWLG